MPRQTSNSSSGSEAKSEVLGTPKFKCQFPGCGKAYQDASTYRIHGYKHTGETFPCRVPCGEGFTDPSSRNRHEKHEHGPESQLRYCCFVVNCAYKPAKRSCQFIAHLRNKHGVCKETRELAPYRFHLSKLDPKHQQPAKSRRRTKSQLSAKSQLPAKFQQSAKSKRAAKFKPPVNSSSEDWICTPTLPTYSDDTQRQATIAATSQIQSQPQHDVFTTHEDVFSPADAVLATDWPNNGLTFDARDMSELEAHQMRMSLPWPNLPQLPSVAQPIFSGTRYLAPSSSYLSDSRSATPESSYGGLRSDGSLDTDMSTGRDDVPWTSEIPFEMAQQYYDAQAQVYVPIPFDDDYTYAPS